MGERLLFLTPQLPYPPHQGGALRNFGLIKGLAQRGHAITLLSLAETGQPPYTETPLAELCTSVLTLPAPARTVRQRLRDLLVGHADMARRLWSLPLLDALRDLLARERFRAIHFGGLEMATYLLPVRATLRRDSSGTLLIYDATNAEYALQARIAQQDRRMVSRWPQAAYSVIQTRRLRRFEAAVCHAADYIFACSQTDAHLLSRLSPSTPVAVVPNAIDVASYDVVQWPPANIPHPALVFTGKMDFRPNVDAVLWFAESILPRIRRSVPEAHFVIVGQKPHPRLEALRGKPGILLTGAVPHIQPYLTAADVYVAPLRMGSGTRLKLLEAMAMGKAVVSTRLGAEGIDVRDGEHLLLADSAAGFAEAVLALLGNETQRKALGDNAACLVRQHYDWSAVIPRVEAVYAASDKT